MSNRTWRWIQIACYAFAFGGGLFAVYSTSVEVGDGIRKMVERPWWFNWVLGLVCLSIFFVVLIEVRIKNGAINGKTIGQTLLWIGLVVAGLMFVWYLRGDL